MQRDRIERIAPASRRRFRDRRRLCDLPRAALQRDDILADRVIARAQPDRRVGIDDPAEQDLQLVEPASPHRDGRYDRHAEFGRELQRIERQPVALGKIEHVERDHDRQTERDQLEREAEMIVEVRRVDHHDQGVGQPLAGLRTGDEVARHALVGARGFEAIGAGQVDQIDDAAIGERQLARMALDRDAGIIANLLPGAGQRVEQRALAGIRIADQRHQRRSGHLTA